jgi:O-methyltransferase involved in polyketide biosynthesis
VSSDAVSPTAHYTGHVWLRNGLSHPALGTLEGKAMFLATEPLMLARRATGGPTLEDYLLARHRTIDELLEEEIDADGVGQVIEIAAGMSPRGWRFTDRHPDLVYVETDLPGMAKRKREALEEIGDRPAGHRVAELDALSEDGDASLDAVAGELDPERGLVVITEGLLSYLEEDDMLGMWRRIARTLERFTSGRYVFDLGVGSLGNGIQAQAFRAALGGFVRGRVHEHFTEDDDAVRALRDAGFGDARVVRPSDDQPTRLPRLGSAGVRRR